MKTYLLFILSAITLFGCSTQNPNPNNNGSNTTNYPSVTICNQVWMTKNLDVDHYRNGDSILQVTDPTQWANLSTGAWCYYNNDPAMGAVYGKLYNWYAVNDPRGLAPSGWHVSSSYEWNKIVKCIDVNADTSCQFCTQSQIAGGALKETGFTHWNTPNLGANNSTGFYGLPGGDRDEINGNFYDLQTQGGWWLSNQYDNQNSQVRYLGWNSAVITREYDYKKCGFSVRCIKD